MFNLLTAPMRRAPQFWGDICLCTLNFLKHWWRLMRLKVVNMMVHKAWLSGIHKMDTTTSSFLLLLGVGGDNISCIFLCQGLVKRGWTIKSIVSITFFFNSFRYDVLILLKDAWSMNRACVHILEVIVEILYMMIALSWCYDFLMRELLHKHVVGYGYIRACLSISVSNLT